MKKLFILGISFLTVVCMTSCYPEGPEYVHEKDIALTHYDENADFGTYKTFVMPDSVVLMSSERDSGLISQESQEKLLNLVKKNFEERNYKYLTAEEAKSQTPDFAVTVSVFTTPTFRYTSWGDYWGWYPGWDWFGWGGPWSSYYPWYPWYGTSVSYYAYDKGTIVMDMLDAKKADADSKHIPVLWSGVIDGILAGRDAYVCERVEKNVNQCFIQSPYLKTTK